MRCTTTPQQTIINLLTKKNSPLPISPPPLDIRLKVVFSLDRNPNYTVTFNMDVNWMIMYLLSNSQLTSNDVEAFHDWVCKNMCWIVYPVIGWNSVMTSGKMKGVMGFGCRHNTRRRRVTHRNYTENGITHCKLSTRLTT